MKMKLHLILLSMVSSGLTTLANPIQISVTGSAAANRFGYVEGQSYTFNWIINESYSGNPGDNFHSTVNQWIEQTTAHAMVFSSISGDGITGTFTQPSDSFDAPTSDLTILDGSSDKFFALAGSKSGSTGIGTQMNGTDMRGMQAYALEIVEFVNPAALTNPTSYFAEYTGTYVPTSGLVYLGSTSNGFLDFLATSVTIETIPEPASATLIAIFGGGAALFRRRFHR